MKTVTMYVADDGTRFTNEADCLRRDALIARIERETRDLLKPCPDSSEFDSGLLYVQQSLGAVRAYKVALLKIACDEIPSFAGPKQLGADPDTIHPWGVVGRWLDECSPPLSRAWYRLLKTDDQGREWDQPFHAAHPKPEAVEFTGQ